MSPKLYRGVLDRFEEKLAVIKLNDGTEVLWPIKNLAKEVKEGSKVAITLIQDQKEQFANEVQAKKMLNDILNVPKDSE